MRIRLSELKRIIKKVVNEAYDTPTISSELDPGEQELSTKYPRWGKNAGQASPASVKAKQVTKILQAKGLTTDAANKKKVTHELVPFIEKMDPADMFAADPDEIAADFASQVLGVHRN